MILILFSFQIVCYYTNWSQYRPKIGKYMPEDIDPDLCTHIIFAFGWLKKGRLSSFESNDETKDGKIGLYDRIMNLKKTNPKLKILLAIGNLKILTYYFIEIILLKAGHRNKNSSHRDLKSVQETLMKKRSRTPSVNLPSQWPKSNVLIWSSIFARVLILN